MLRHSSHTRRTWIGVCVLMAAALGAFVWWQTGFRTKERGTALRTARQMELLERGAREYRRIPMLSLAAVGGAQELAKALDTTKFNNAPGTGVGSEGALIQAVAEFLWFRFGGGTPQEYRDWRSRIGGEPLALSELKETFMMAHAYEVIVGAPPPANADFATYFDDIWTAAELKEHARITKIAAAPRGQAGVFGRQSRLDLSLAPLSGDLPTELWHGLNGAGSPCWFRLRSGDDQLSRPDGIPYGRVGMIVELADGRRYPCVITCVWDRKSGRWWVRHMNHFNTDFATLPSFVF